MLDKDLEEFANSVVAATRETERQYAQWKIGVILGTINIYLENAETEEAKYYLGKIVEDIKDYFGEKYNGILQ